MLRHALERNRDLFSDEAARRILAPPSIQAKLNELFLYAGDCGIPLYNGNFELLRQILGEEEVDGNVQVSFPLEQLDQPENFLSLLYYFGLLSMRDGAEGVPSLAIPNQTVKRLMYGYLRDAYRDVGAFAVNLHAFGRLTHEMAFRGAWEPVFAFLRDAIAEQTAIRDYMRGEKVLHGFLAAYLSVTDHFVFHAERELNKGYADICLEPLAVVFHGGDGGVRRGVRAEGLTPPPLRRAAGRPRARHSDDAHPSDRSATRCDATLRRGVAE